MNEHLCVVCGKPVRKKWGRPPSKCCSMACRRIREDREAVVKTCETCGKPFRLSPSQNTPDRKHCSKTCYDRHQREQGANSPLVRPAVCPICGTAFQSRFHKGYWSKYCSLDCYDSERHPQAEKTCEHCGQTFMAKWRPARDSYEQCCSRECGNANRKHGHHTECCVCGAPIYRSPARVLRSATGWFYCSATCKNQGMVDERCGKSWKEGVAILETHQVRISLLNLNRQPRHDRGPNATRRVYAAMHRLIVEAVLGRTLTPDEPVWHLDRDLGNNDPHNLYLFPTMSAMWNAISKNQYPETTNLPTDQCTIVATAMAEARTNLQFIQPEEAE